MKLQEVPEIGGYPEYCLRTAFENRAFKAKKADKV
jgi:hypothetical protein